jgi:hypothetical protein
MTRNLVFGIIGAGVVIAGITTVALTRTTAGLTQQARLERDCGLRARPRVRELVRGERRRGFDSCAAHGGRADVHDQAGDTAIAA